VENHLLLLSMCAGCAQQRTGNVNILLPVIFLLASSGLDVTPAAPNRLLTLPCAIVVKHNANNLHLLATLYHAIKHKKSQPKTQKKTKKGRGLCFSARPADRQSCGSGEVHHSIQKNRIATRSKDATRDKCIASSNKCLTSSNKDATRGSWPYY